MAMTKRSSRSPSDQQLFAPIGRACFARKFRMLNRAVTALYDEALRPFGLKVSQMNVLVAVAVLGPTPQAAVAKELRLEKSTLSRNLERLAEKGWIRVDGGPDGRSNELSLTPAGRKLLQDLKPAWRGVQRRLQRLLGPEAADAIDGMLGALGDSGP